MHDAGYRIEDNVNPGDEVTGAFQVGKDYSIYMYLVGADGYSMVLGDVITYTANSTTKTANAKKITIDGNTYTYIEVCCQITVQESVEIESVPTTINKDLDGVSTSDYTAYATLNTDSLVICENGIYAMDDEQNEIEVFEEGKTYDLWIFLEAKTGYQLPSLGEKVSCTINGENVQGTVCYEGGSVQSYYLEIVYEMTVPVTIGEISFEYTGYEYGNDLALVAVTSQEQIDVEYAFVGDKAFYKCKALTKVIIPKNVSKIGKKYFMVVKN